MRCEYFGEGFWLVTVRFGFVEIPDLSSVISQVRKRELPTRDEPTYYIERHDPISRKSRSVVSRWRVALLPLYPETLPM
jgi:KUP system potassium uptake protein